jgi:hypothetical protein
LKNQLVQRAGEVLRAAVIGHRRTVVGSDIGKIVDREYSRLCLLDAAFGDLLPSIVIVPIPPLPSPPSDLKS